jgi:hypothetical protein
MAPLHISAGTLFVRSSISASGMCITISSLTHCSDAITCLKNLRSLTRILKTSWWQTIGSMWQACWRTYMERDQHSQQPQIQHLWVRFLHPQQHWKVLAHLQVRYPSPSVEYPRANLHVAWSFMLPSNALCKRICCQSNFCVLHRCSDSSYLSDVLHAP